MERRALLNTVDLEVCGVVTAAMKLKDTYSLEGKL